MAFFGAILRLGLIAGAAVLGNYVGNFLARPGEDRATAFGEGAMPLRPTNFLPAIGLALLSGPPRVVYAFVSGAVISILIGDRYEYLLQSPPDRVSL